MRSEAEQVKRAPRGARRRAVKNTKTFATCIGACEMSFVAVLRSVVLVSLILCCNATTLLAAGASTGREFSRRLKANVGIQWQGNPIRDAFGNLSAAQQLAFFLDRRIPPDDLLNYRTEPKPLWSALDELTERQELGWSTLGPVVLIGPKASATRLPSIAAVQRGQLANLPASRRVALSKSAPLAWKRLARPRDVIQSLAEEAGLKVVNLDAVPHDLWPEASLPSMPWTDRVALVLNGFDLLLRIDESGRTATVAEIPAAGAFPRLHKAPPGTRIDFARLQRTFPDLRVARVRTEYRVTGTFTQHDAVAKWLVRESTLLASGRSPNRPRPPRNVRQPTQVYDLRIDNQPVGGVLKALCQKLGWTPQVSPSASQRLTKLISFEVKGATQEELLNAAVKPAGLRYKLNGKVLEITTTEEP